ncbi:DUF1285 domain-containing protein [Nguyenibacter sp. L1]|uniref:DUF1285 domain-containing protein n=1 Tax=Nguyenibacter sp. L1 TaxID=3049350 RepID=UPI002B486B48|nr:DUF1285 domain-containing protein [Nguyenibacter sp. L1]WRH87539.1 DUF1285 domain-containing protein [Nguyenibacter sp. L1]
MPPVPPRRAADADPCGPLPFLVKRDGTWLYRGTPIRRKPMICLFASVLTRDAQGAYWLETPTERGTITVEDAPLVAVELHWTGCGRDQVLSFRTNVDLVVCAGPDHPIHADWDMPGADCGAGPVPYLHVRDGAGDYAIQARIARAVYYELAALAVPGACRGVPCLGVWSQNVFFPLSRLSPADLPQEDLPQEDFPA